ncbi:MAG: GGDEF domain-containing protein [Burkholderiaceae bacterium]
MRDSLEWRCDDAYLSRKFEDHRTFLVGLCLLLSVLAPVLWIWDLAIDAQGARQTLVLRALYLLLLPAAAMLAVLRARRQVAFAAGMLLLGGQALYMLIASRLQDGIVYSFAGFTYFLFITPFVSRAFSMRVNLMMTTGVTLAPHVLALGGLVAGFPHAMYASLILPGSVLVVLLGAGMGRNYERRFLTERALEQASNTDPLTGVANRRAFARMLHREILRAGEQASPLSVLMLDIDRFKSINDAHGHATGDRVIRALADLCRDASPERVGRLGGEEFSVLLPDTGSDEAMTMAARLIERVRQAPFELDDGDLVHWTVSIGVATHRADEPLIGDRPDEALLARADAALYSAKQAGRDRIAGVESMRGTGNRRGPVREPEPESESAAARPLAAR